MYMVDTSKECLTAENIPLNIVHADYELGTYLTHKAMRHSMLTIYSSIVNQQLSTYRSQSLSISLVFGQASIYCTMTSIDSHCKLQ